MIQTHDSLPETRHCSRPGRVWPCVAAIALGIVCLLQGRTLFAAEPGPGSPPIEVLSLPEVFTFLFLMLGPIKIIAPFAKVTQAADTRLARRIALRAILFSSFALLLAAILGEESLRRYGVPLPVLALAAGIILFLVALQSILQQFTGPAQTEEAATVPSLKAAITPIAFPTIVTPYGTAALIIFIALSPDLNGKLTVGALLLGIMLLNMIAMLLARHILRFLGVFLQIVGSVLGIIQVALGLQIILEFLKKAWMLQR